MLLLFYLIIVFSKKCEKSMIKYEKIHKKYIEILKTEPIDQKQNTKIHACEDNYFLTIQD